METFLIILGFIAFFAVVIIFVGFIQKKQVEKLNVQFTNLANKFGIEAMLEQPKKFSLKTYQPRASGDLGGTHLEVYTYTTGSGKHKQYWTAASLNINNQSGNNFKIYQQGFFSKIGKAFGMQDIEIGDPDVDSKLILKSSDEHFLKSLMTRPIKNQFMRLYDLPGFTGTVELQGPAMKYTQMGFMTNDKVRAKIEHSILLMKAIANEIEGLGPTGQAQSFFEEESQSTNDQQVQNQE